MLLQLGIGVHGDHSGKLFNDHKSHWLAVIGTSGKRSYYAYVQILIYWTWKYRFSPNILLQLVTLTKLTVVRILGGFSF